MSEVYGRRRGRLAIAKLEVPETRKPKPLVKAKVKLTRKRRAKTLG